MALSTDDRHNRGKPTELLAQLVEDRDGDAVQRGLDEHHCPEPWVVDPHIRRGSIPKHQDLSLHGDRGRSGCQKEELGRTIRDREPNHE